MENKPVLTSNEYNWFDGSPSKKGAYRTRQVEGSPNYCWRYWDGQNWHIACSTYSACVAAFKEGVRRNVRQAKPLLWGRKLVEEKRPVQDASQELQDAQRRAAEYEERLLALLNALGCGRPGDTADIKFLGEQPASALAFLGRQIAEQASKAQDAPTHPEEITASRDYVARNAPTLVQSVENAKAVKEDMVAAFHAGALHQRLSTHMIREKLGVTSWPAPGDKLVDSRVYFAPEVRALIARAVCKDREEHTRSQMVTWTSHMGSTTSLSIDQAANMLREFFDRWPDGLNEVEAALEGSSIRTLSTNEIDRVFNTMPGGKNRYMIEWGYTTFAREILKLAMQKKHASPDEDSDD